MCKDKDTCLLPPACKRGNKFKENVPSWLLGRFLKLQDIPTATLCSSGFTTQKEKSSLREVPVEAQEGTQQRHRARRDRTERNRETLRSRAAAAQLGFLWNSSVTRFNPSARLTELNSYLRVK